MKKVSRHSISVPDLTSSPSSALVNAASRKDFVSFARKCFHWLSPGATFQMNWHLAAMAHQLERVRFGNVKRLIITVPPRSLKSMMCSVAFPAFVLGHDPTKRLIAVSYGTDLAIKHANDFRTVVGNAQYGAMFPAMRLSSMKNTQTEVVTTQNGFRLASSVDGALTGRGGDIIIIDDPIAALAALSQKAREHLLDWYRNTLLSRLDDKQNGSIVIVMQRLHEDDLVGVLLRESDDWTLLNLPAIAEADERIPLGNGNFHYRRTDDLLHPEREPKAILDSLRAQLGADIFAAQYQQRPASPEGVMIQREWFRRYEELPRPKSPLIVQSWDIASKEGPENDWSVCTTWLIFENRYYLVDVLRGRFDYPTLKGRVVSHAKRHKPNKILIEDVGVGTALVQDLKTASFSVIPIKPEHDKKTRMSIQTAKFESGRVLFPTHAPWLADFEDELCAFPRGRHDDQVDSVSQALAQESAVRRPILPNYGGLCDLLWEEVLVARLASGKW